MSREDFIRKISSRKFWALLAGLVTSGLVLYNVPDGQIAQIVATIGAFGTVIAYIFGEAMVDSSNK